MQNQANRTTSYADATTSVQQLKSMMEARKAVLIAEMTMDYAKGRR